jgi:hypothetical protein
MQMSVERPNRSLADAPKALRAWSENPAGFTKIMISVD